jgi:RES domain
MEPLVAELKAGMRLWRGHSLFHPGDEFNPTDSVTRFTPVWTAAGKHLPYMYLGNSSEVAIAETVLHDVLGGTPSSTIPATKVEGMALSELRLRRPVRLIDLSGHGLRRIHQTQAELIASLPSEYARTAQVAQRLLDAQPTAEGILYPSRQFGAGLCAVVYRRARRRNPFERLQSLPLTAGLGRAWVDLACAQAGVTVVY